MRPNDYVSDVLKTESNNFEALAQRLSETRNIRLLHATMGVVTEVGELFELLKKENLDLTNLKEEVGDSLWYCGVAVDELKLDFDSLVANAQVSVALDPSVLVTEELKRRAIEGILANATMDSSILLDLMKKSAFYGKPLDQVKFESTLLSVLGSMSTLLVVGGFRMEEAMEVNIAKLKKRYGAKFSESAAITRDLDAERKILEGKK